MKSYARALAGNTSRFIKKNSAIILAIAGVIGVGAAVYTTAKAVPKAQEKIKEAEDKKGKELDGYETFVAAAPSYILPASITVATVACIVGGAVIGRKHEKSLIAAYGLVDSSFKRYRSKLIDLHGEEADREIRDAVCREYCDVCLRDIDFPDGKYIWVDDISGRTIEAYERQVMEAEYHLNRNFTMRGYATLNEFYNFLGLPETEEGERIGWSMSDGYTWIDVEHRRLDNPDENGTPCYAIDFIFGPDAECLEDWVCPWEVEHPRED